jgi:Predicted membrane protein (DUF2306)
MTMGQVIAEKALKAAAVLWFLAALAGQWAFVIYIAGFYAAPTLQGDFEAWNRNKNLVHGYVVGDAAGNLAFAAHVMMAAIITFAGTLQLIPQIRARAISFHRWNGRLFILTAFAISLAGLFLTWSRENVGLASDLAISLNAVLIMFCAAQTLGFALARDIDTHRRWALRTFLLVNGVWFLRVGMMLWAILTQGSSPYDEAFFLFWTFGSYLIPLAVLELYLRTQDRGGAAAKVAMAALLLVLTAGMGVGIFGAAMFMWRPLLLSG